MRKFVALIAILIVCLTVGVVTAQDDEPMPTNEVIATSTVQLTLDCSSLSGRQLAEARRLDICPKANNNADVTPQTTVNGNCGSATLTIFASTRSGSAFYYTALNSTKGPMVGGSLSVAWAGPSGSGSFGTGVPFFQSSWSKNTLINTGVGIASGTFGGWVGIVGTSLICSVGPVPASGYVS